MSKAPSGSLQKSTVVKEPFTKTQLLSVLAENTGLTKKQVGEVLEELSVVISRHIEKRAAGTFTLPGLLKIKTVRKPATKSRQMISPFTGNEITVEAKPARTIVKVQPLKSLREMVE